MDFRFARMQFSSRYEYDLPCNLVGYRAMCKNLIIITHPSIRLDHDEHENLKLFIGKKKKKKLL